MGIAPGPSLISGSRGVGYLDFALGFPTRRKHHQQTSRVEEHLVKSQLERPIDTVKNTQIFSSTLRGPPRSRLPTDRFSGTYLVTPLSPSEYPETRHLACMHNHGLHMASIRYQARRTIKSRIARYSIERYVHKITEEGIRDKSGGVTE